MRLRQALFATDANEPVADLTTSAELVQFMHTGPTASPTASATHLKLTIVVSLLLLMEDPNF